MASILYLFAVTVLLLVALAVSIPVLLDIYREGMERQRTGRTSETDPDRTEMSPETTTTTDDTPNDTRVCTHCGAQNDPEFTYCHQCAERL